VRLLALAALPFSVFALAGCTGSDVDVELVWAGPPDADPGGVVSVNGFATYQNEVDEHWERSAAMTAAEFLRLDERTVSRTTIESRAEPGEGSGPSTVTVTLAGLLDDSVRAERWRLGFQQRGEVYALTAALREQRCHRGRGHSGFSPEPCA
jgi:hypothetical protein